MEVSPEKLAQHGISRETARSYFLANPQERSRMRQEQKAAVLEAFQHIFGCMATECGNCWQKLNEGSMENQDDEIQLLLHHWDSLSPLSGMLAWA